MPAREAIAQRPKPRLLSPVYALVCASTLLYFTSQMMQIPVFPDYLRERSGASDAMIGVFIGLFSVTGVGLRPLIGRELRTQRRRRWMAIGGIVTATSALAYVATSQLGLLLPVRLYHGIAIASLYTAAATLVADIAPAERRAEAISYFSMFLYLGLAVGPALGLALNRWSGFGAVFGVSAGLGALCTIIALVIREPAPSAAETDEHVPLISRRALFPTAVLGFAAVAYAAGLTFTADMAERAGIAGNALYFPVLAGTVIATRMVSGRLADRFGRVVVAAPGLALFGVSMLLEAGATTLAPLLVSAIMFGVGFGVFFPSMMAFTIDRVPEAERGTAMGTFTAAFDVGFGGGAPVLGAIVGAAGYAAMYRFAAGFVFAGLLVLLAGTMRAARRHAGPAVETATVP